ncbi:hypothetical protein HDV00_007589 [Rhizophlyctis rosea]|nr:hypothetical protein HDV00_007589 [Rhizophlyctis rosea]
MMIIIRGIQGIGAACTIPNAVALIIQLFPPGRPRDRAMSLFACTGAVGFSLGLIIGGFLTESSLGWRWIFHIPGIMAGVMAVLAFFSIPPPLEEVEEVGETGSIKKKPSKGSIDILGAILSTAAVLMFVFVLTDGNVRGWSNPLILCLLFLSLILAATFVYAEYKISDPLMPLSIWKLPNFAAAFVIAMCVTGFFVNYTYYITLIFQEVWGWSASEAAIRFLPIGIVCIIVCLLAENLIFYFNIKLALTGGLLLGVIGNVILGFYKHEDQYWSVFFVSAIVGVAGLASVYTSVVIAAFNAAPSNQAGIVGGLLNTAFQLGTGLGLAITTPIVTSINASSTGLDLLKGYHAAIWTTVGILGFALIISIVFVHVVRKPSGDEEVAVEEVDVTRKSKEVGRVGSSDTVVVRE